MNVYGLALLVVVYLCVVVGLGYLGYRRTRDHKDYLIAGGEAHPFLMAMAYGSTFISTAAIVGFGGVASLYGMGLMWLTFANIFCGIFLAFVVYGKRTAVIGRRLGAYTFPEFLGKRYNSNFIRRLTALIVVLAMPVYTAAVMLGASRFVESTLNVDYRLAMLVFAVIVGTYVITGGLKGVMYTDAFQGTVMLVSMLILIGYTYISLGGVTAAHQSLTDLGHLVPEALAAKGHAGWTSMPVLFSEYWWVLVSTFVMGVGLGVLAQPQLVVRFLTVRGARELNRGVVIGGLFILITVGSVYVVGALTNVYFHETLGVISLGAATDGNIDTVIPLYINAALPAWFTYVFMLTLLAAALSTLSGQFHTIGTSAGHDLYQRPSILVSRLGILTMLVVTVVLCHLLPGSIVAVATALFFGICAATFLPVYTAALFWKKVTTAGATASMVVGLTTSLFWMAFFHAKEATAFGLAQALFGRETVAGYPWVVVDPIVISLPLSALTLVTVSLLTRSQPERTPDPNFRPLSRG